MTAMDIFKKAALMGIGVLSMTEEKLKELVKELETKGEVTEKEGKDLFKNLLSRADEEKKALEEKIKKGIKDYLGKVDIASKEEVAKLEKRLHALEKKINEMMEER